MNMMVNLTLIETSIHDNFYHTSPSISRDILAALNNNRLRGSRIINYASISHSINKHLTHSIFIFKMNSI